MLRWTVAKVVIVVVGIDCCCGCWFEHYTSVTIVSIEFISTTGTSTSTMQEEEGMDRRWLDIRIITHSTIRSNAKLWWINGFVLLLLLTSIVVVCIGVGRGERQGETSVQIWVHGGIAVVVCDDIHDKRVHGKRRIASHMMRLWLRWLWWLRRTNNHKIRGKGCRGCRDQCYR